MLPSVRALKVAVQCASPCPFAAGVSAAGIANWTDMRRGLGRLLHCTNAGGQLYTPARLYPLAGIQASGMRPEHGYRNFFRPTFLIIIRWLPEFQPQPPAPSGS